MAKGRYGTQTRQQALSLPIAACSKGSVQFAKDFFRTALTLPSKLAANFPSNQECEMKVIMSLRLSKSRARVYHERKNLWIPQSVEITRRRKFERNSQPRSKGQKKFANVCKTRPLPLPKQLTKRFESIPIKRSRWHWDSV